MLPRKLLLNTLKQLFSLNVRDQGSYSSISTDKIKFLYILNFAFWDMNRKQITIKYTKLFPEFDLFLISSWIWFWSVIVVIKYLNLKYFGRICYLTVWHICTEIINDKLRQSAEACEALQSGSGVSRQNFVKGFLEFSCRDPLHHTCGP